MLQTATNGCIVSPINVILCRSDVSSTKFLQTTTMEIYSDLPSAQKADTNGPMHSEPSSNPHVAKSQSTTPTVLTRRDSVKRILKRWLPIFKGQSSRISNRTGPSKLKSKSHKTVLEAPRSATGSGLSGKSFKRQRSEYSAEADPVSVVSKEPVTTNLVENDSEVQASSHSKLAKQSSKHGSAHDFTLARYESHTTSVTKLLPSTGNKQNTVNPYTVWTEETKQTNLTTSVSNQHSWIQTVRERHVELTEEVASPMYSEDDSYERVRIPRETVLKCIAAHSISQADSMPVEVVPGLYIGSVGAATNRKALEENNISHVICAAAGIAPVFSSAGIQYLLLELEDYPSADITRYLDVSSQYINNALKYHGNVLVHCFAGRSRSAAIVAAYLIRYHQMTFEEAIQAIKSKKRNIRPNKGFCYQLESFSSSDVNKHST